MPLNGQPGSLSSSESLGILFTLKLLRKGLGEVGIQLVLRGGVFGTPITFPGEVLVAIFEN